MITAKYTNIKFQTAGQFEDTRFEKIHNIVCLNSIEGSICVAQEISELIKSKQAENKLCILGLATGVVVDDELCQLLKLSRQLYASGLKVAAISLLAQDPRVFDSLVMAGTPPPYMGSIGTEALEKWKSNPDMIPEGSVVFKDNVLEINTQEEDVDDGEFQKFLFLAMAMWIGVPILF